MGNQGEITNNQSGKIYLRFTSYFLSEFHFREETYE